MPVFLYETPAGIFYGDPQIGAWGVEVAEHTDGQAVADPLTVDRTINEQARSCVENFLRLYLSRVSPMLRKHAVRLYSMSLGSHFVFDRHPNIHRSPLLLGSPVTGLSSLVSYESFLLT